MALRAAFAFTIASRLVSLGLMAVGFAVLGRLLPAAAFGHFALAVAIFGLAQIVANFGLRQRIVARPEAYGPDEVAAAAGLSLMLSLGLCLCLLAAAAALGGTLLPGPLAATLVPLALALPVTSLGLAPEALLQRSLRFGLLSGAEVLRTVVDVLVGVSLALAGFGPVAMGVGVLASRCAITLVLLLATEPALRILPRPGAAHLAWRDHGGWGGRLAASQIIPQVAALGIIGSLGALQGMAALGLFNRAQTIHQMLDKSLLEGIKPVILPAFSEALRGGTDPRRVYRIKLDMLTAICWPTFALIALLADDIVAVLLGPAWEEAVPIVRILALMGLGMPATKMSQKLFVAIDAVPTLLRIEVTREALRVPLAVVGAAISLPAFAIVYVAGNWFKAVGITIALDRALGGPEGGHGAIALRASALTLATLAGPVALLWGGDLAAATRLALSLPLAALGWCAATVAVRHPIASEIRGAALRARELVRPRQG